MSKANGMLQAATAYQHDIARSLGLPSHKVVCHVKRVGGAFGGKETRFIPVTAAAAVAAREIGRPVRIALERQEDMVITGHRHSFLIRYKVSFLCMASACLPHVTEGVMCSATGGYGHHWVSSFLIRYEVSIPCMKPGHLPQASSL